MISYFTIERIEEILYKDRSSKFIGFAYPVNDETDIKLKLEHIKQLHPKATHHCYAYRLGSDKNNYRANDDGEPGGSAGKPILGQIDSFGVTNCLVIVVRYFGGTKLGVPGLVSAYKETAKLVLSSTRITEQKIRDHYRLKCNYTDVNRVFKVIHQYDAQIIEQHLENTASFIISVEPGNSPLFQHQLREEQIEFDFLEKK